MIEIVSPAAPQRRPFLRRAIRKSQRRLLDDAPRTSRDHRRHAESALTSAADIPLDRLALFAKNLRVNFEQPTRRLVVFLSRHAD